MIRPYKKEDIPRIVELEKMHLESSLEESFYLNDLTNPFARHYVYEQDGTIIGFISTIFDGFSLEILNFVIEQSCQSLGYGTELLVTVLDELVSQGLNHVSLEVRESNTKAIHVYEKLGFKTIRVRKEYYKNKEDAFFMQKLYDEKKDIANLEAILFSKKEGLKYTSDFKERYCLNYYDLYDYKIDSLKNFTYDSYILFLSNWIDEKLFEGYDISCCALMHVNAYHYKSLSKKKYDVHLNYLADHLDFTYRINLEYGEEYAKKYARFTYEKIKEGKIKTFAVLSNDKTIGRVKILEYYHSIFIYALYVEEEYRHQGIASSLLDSCVNYAKQVNKCELYLEADTDDTPIEMYKKMNFTEIEKLYESFLEK